MNRRVLATDLDGTLVPLEGNTRNQQDLLRLTTCLQKSGIALGFVTGRHFQSVQRAMRDWGLPQPDWIICDVGTSIFARNSSREYELVEEYYHHQDAIVSSLPIDDLRRQLQSISGLRLQEEEKQGRFKLSFYTAGDRLGEIVSQIRHRLDYAGDPYSVIHSVDPFHGDGLIDLLPMGVSKAYALRWWINKLGQDDDEIVFAGDSGNDYAALTAGYRSILVGNADRHLAREIYEYHRQACWNNRLFLANQSATSGLVEGAAWFGLFDHSTHEDRQAIQKLGATCVDHKTTHFRVWAPKSERVEVEITDDFGSRSHPLEKQGHGYFAGQIQNCAAGSCYQYLLNGELKRPDPVSRFQPAGVHGASQVVDVNRFPWTDQAWKGVRKRDLVIYELHIGAFTQAGNFQAALDRLPELIDLGVTAIEIMPVAQSPGRWNWGYDGVNLYAPRQTYGQPEDFKAFVDACHSQGLAVILDVVYNHLGPEGNYLSDFGPYFSDRHGTPWGEAFNFDGASSEQVRRFIVDNVVYWLDEYHLDGLRLDAVHFMLDESGTTILDEIRLAVARYQASTPRQLHMIAEANVYDRELLTDKGKRPAYDGIWCDCLMHSIYSNALPELRLTHRTYQGAGDLAESLEHGFLYYACENRPQRVESTRREEFNAADRSAFVTALQTHDAVGNHPHGKRLHHLSSKDYQKAAAALILLYPSIPMIFMGEETASESPFPFFADFEDPRLRIAVEEGRAKEYPQHLWGSVMSPGDAETFQRAKCYDPAHFDPEVFAWYRDLLTIRKQGIREGWLSAHCMSTAYDSEQQIFSIRFACNPCGHVWVHSRLGAASPRSREDSVRLRIDGEILLSSHPTTVSDGYVALAVDQAIVSRW